MEKTFSSYLTEDPNVAALKDKATKIEVREKLKLVHHSESPSSDRA